MFSLSLVLDILNLYHDKILGMFGIRWKGAERSDLILLRGLTIVKGTVSQEITLETEY